MENLTQALQNLDPLEKLKLVEQIWDELADEATQLPIPDWATIELARRRDEMLADTNFGSDHQEVWKRIQESRNA